MKKTKTGKRAFPIEGIDAALRRAARKALEIGERTTTPVYILHEGKIVDLRKHRARTKSSKAAKGRAPTSAV